MKTGKLARALLRVLAVLVVLAAFVALDWYPTVKELSLLRRQGGDLERKIKEYNVMAGTFQFPEKGEDSLLAAADAEPGRLLPRVENDNGWEAISIFDLQARVREDGIPHARFLFNHQIDGLEMGVADTVGAGPLASWISREFWDMQTGFSLAFDPGSFHWHGVSAGLEFRRGQRLANRPLAVALAAPLPVVLSFINHISWGETRLEIVRLRLEPAGGSALAWLVCRGSYLVPGPSPWLVKMKQGEGGAQLLIDPDSPLLWRQANPLFAPAVEKRELPPASGGNHE